MQQCADHRRIDATRQSEQHSVAPHLLAHPRDRVDDDVAGLPTRVAAADLAYEALEYLQALQRVCDFRMELNAVEMSRFIRHCGERHGRRESGGDEAGWQLVHAI